MNRDPADRASPLVTDYYAFTMLITYLETGRTGTAVFEFFVRPPLPASRRFFVAAGLGEAGRAGGPSFTAAPALGGAPVAVKLRRRARRVGP